MSNLIINTKRYICAIWVIKWGKICGKLRLGKELPLYTCVGLSSALNNILSSSSSLSSLTIPLLDLGQIPIWNEVCRSGMSQE
jgi:hypothetical protein